MKRPALALLTAVLMLPSLAFGFASIPQTAHSFACNVALGASLDKRKQAMNLLMAGDFSHVKAHNQKLRQMNDEEFTAYMTDEVLNVALCHPMTSDLLGMLPGTDYLSIVNTLTSVPSSLDRKVTYAIWAYNHLLRSLNARIAQLESNLDRFSPPGERDELKNIKNLVDDLGKLTPADIARGAAGSILDQWQGQKTNIPHVEGARSEAIREQRPDHKNDIHKANGDGDVITEHAPQQGNDGKPEAGNHSGGPLRPTIPVYALQGQTLKMYEVDSVHILFPAGTGPQHYCYERFAPEYPVFARLLNADKAQHIATAELNADEKNELLKFFNSAAGVQAQAFLLADQIGLALESTDKRRALKNCLQLATPEAAGHAFGWEHAEVVRFRADDKLWQTLMGMLASKRIMISIPQP